MPNRPPVRNRRLGSVRQGGVTLVEVLVAVLVLSIGFLGMAALQVQSLSTNTSAMSRSLAVIASYTILDAIRSDRASAVAGAYNGTVTANACPNGTSLAAEQLIHWCQQLGAGLGAAASTSGTINCSAVGDCTVTVQFDDRKGWSGDNVDDGVDDAKDYQQIQVRARI